MKMMEICISWNGGVPKLDIRDWSPEYEKMGKGVKVLFCTKKKTEKSADVDFSVFFMRRIF